MTLIDRLKKVAILVMNKRKTSFSVSVSEQKRFLEVLPEPRNDIERSYNQYRCQCYLKGRLIVFAQNIVGLFLLGLYILRYMWNATKKNAPEVFDAVFVHEDKPQNILPDELSVQYSKIKFNHKCVPILEKGDVMFLKNVAKGRRVSFFFLFRCMNDIAEYAAIVKKYTPKAIISCMEYSFTSSVLTSYCEEKGIEHINVMHGEKTFSIRNSFFRFSSCYVWDIYYKELFIKTKAKQQQFIISVPESLYGKIESGCEKEYDYVYYLTDENNEQLNKLYGILLEMESKLKVKGCVRPHPRYSNVKAIEHIFKEITIEDTKSVSVEESLSKTCCVISSKSTVLLQAYYKGIEVVIDDITCNSIFEEMKEKEYMMLSKKHHLLSDMIRNEV